MEFHPLDELLVDSNFSDESVKSAQTESDCLKKLQQATDEIDSLIEQSEFEIPTLRDFRPVKPEVPRRDPFEDLTTFDNLLEKRTKPSVRRGFNSVGEIVTNFRQDLTKTYGDAVDKVDSFTWNKIIHDMMSFVQDAVEAR